MVPYILHSRKRIIYYSIRKFHSNFEEGNSTKRSWQGEFPLLAIFLSCRGMLLLCRDGPLSIFLSVNSILSNIIASLCFSKSKRKFITTFHHFGKEIFFPLPPYTTTHSNMSFNIRRESIFSSSIGFYFFLLSLYTLRMLNFAYACRQLCAHSGAKSDEGNFPSTLLLLPYLSQLNLRKQRNLFSKQYQSNENPNDLTWKFLFTSTLHTRKASLTLTWVDKFFFLLVLKICLNSLKDCLVSLRFWGRFLSRFMPNLCWIYVSIII